MSDLQSPPAVELPAVSIVRRSTGPEPRLSVSGEVDLVTAPILEQAIAEAEHLRPQRIVLELSGLDFIDSSGLKVLCEAYVRARETGRLLLLEDVPANVARVFEVGGLGELLMTAGPSHEPV